MDCNVIHIVHAYIIYRAGIENISVMFAKPDKRASWEESFNEAKQKLGEYSSATNVSYLESVSFFIIFQVLVYTLKIIIFFIIFKQYSVAMHV